jgi:hypothetical protein
MHRRAGAWRVAAFLAMARLSRAAGVGDVRIVRCDCEDDRAPFRVAA